MHDFLGEFVFRFLGKIICYTLSDVFTWAGDTVRDIRANQEEAKRQEQERRVKWLLRPHRELLRPAAAPAADELLRPVLSQPETAPDELLRPSDSAYWIINGMKR